VDYYWGLLIWAGIVVVSMLIVIVLAQRWGRDPFGFALLAAVLRPIAIVALVGSRQSDRSRPHRFEPRDSGHRVERAGQRSVLLPVDGSQSAARAAAAIPTLGLRDIEAIVLTVLPREAEPRADASPQQQQEHQREIDRSTGDAVKVLKSAGVPHRVLVGYGKPGEEIVEAASEQGAEMIIVGRKGAGLTKSLLGSVSDHVVKHASVPVVVID
jgi:nucleotide-binding universal stress UspA family protein